MAEDKPSTPEQQLLKLIEESARPGKEPAAAPKLKAPGISLEKVIDQWVGKFLGKLSFLKRSGQKSLARRRKMPLDLASVNRAVLVLAITVFLYVLYDAVTAGMNLKRPANFVPAKDMSVPFAKESIEPLKETSYYLQKVSSRNIFREGRIKQEAKPESAGGPAEGEANAAIQALSLVGISWSSNPDAIIEDKTSQKTFFVKRGQMVGDAVKVEAIFKDHVVLSSEDKEFELR